MSLVDRSSTSSSAAACTLQCTIFLDDKYHDKAMFLMMSEKKITTIFEFAEAFNAEIILPHVI